MSVQRQQKKKPVTPIKSAGSIISANPTRRSRAERSLVQLTNGSYPHCFIGNIGHCIFGDDESKLKQVLDTENKFHIMEFIRELSLETEVDKVTFTAGTVRIDGNTNRVDNQFGGDLTEITFIAEGAEARAGLANNKMLPAQMVEIFHRNKVRGMTRRYDIAADSWRMVEKKLTVGSSGGFGGLGRTETKFDISHGDTVALLARTLAEESYTLILGASSITIISGGDDKVTKEITYEVPDKL